MLAREARKPKTTKPASFASSAAPGRKALSGTATREGAKKIGSHAAKSAAPGASHDLSRVAEPATVRPPSALFDTIQRVEDSTRKRAKT